MTREEMQQIKEFLISERETIEQNNIEKKSMEIDTDGDEIDAANSIVEEDFNNRIYTRNLIYLEKIKVALSNMESGTYGICTMCEEEIEFKRLKARPTTYMCISCKEYEEGLDSKTRNGSISKSRAKMGYNS